MRVVRGSGTARTVAAATMLLASLGGATGVAVAGVPAESVPPVARAAVSIKAVTLGFVHSCALNTAGGVKCWGYNGEG